jgi:hypothetical protein
MIGREATRLSVCVAGGCLQTLNRPSLLNADQHAEKFTEELRHPPAVHASGWGDRVENSQ